MKKISNMIIRILVVLLVNTSIKTVLRVLASVLQGEHGAPSFATPAFTVYGLLTELLLLGAYILIGYQIPVKSKIKKGLLFTLLFWASDYMAQILGMFGADSPILSADAMSLKTIILDSVGYFIGGIIMGAKLTFKEAEPKRDCPRKHFILASLVSMILFPGVLFLLEMLVGLMNPSYLSYAAFEIRKEDMVSFYLVFYLFQAISGLLFPIFYRYTEYNSMKEGKWLKFANVYGCMLWSPIAIIVAFFGVGLSVTLAFAGIMLMAIYIDTYIFAKLLHE